jgi:hypothetical protein
MEYIVVKVLLRRKKYGKEDDNFFLSKNILDLSVDLVYYSFTGIDLARAGVPEEVQVARNPSRPSLLPHV